MEILSLLASWLTPMSLFLLLNLMIATIVITSRFGLGSMKPQSGSDPSPLLNRIKSIDLSGFKFTQSNPEHVDSAPLHLVDSTDSPVPSEPAAPLKRAPSLLKRVTSFNLSSFHKSEPTKFEIVSDENVNLAEKDLENKTKRSNSERRSAAVTSSKKMKKWGSEKQEGKKAETAEEVEMRRPATARYERSTSFGDGADSVDAKAAAFINRFKHQLKLQRLDSILRYK